MEVVIPLAKYALTTDGEDAIALFEKSAKEHTDQEEKERLREKKEDIHRRREAWRSWLQVIFVFVTEVLMLFLGAYLAQNTSLLDWFTELFN